MILKVGEYVKFKDDLGSENVVEKYRYHQSKAHRITRLRDHGTTWDFEASGLLWDKKVIDYVITKEKNPEYFL